MTASCFREARPCGPWGVGAWNLEHHRQVCLEKTLEKEQLGVKEVGRRGGLLSKGQHVASLDLGFGVT